MGEIFPLYFLIFYDAYRMHNNIIRYIIEKKNVIDAILSKYLSYPQSLSIGTI